MSDQGNDKPAALSPSFASLLKKANNTVLSKPNFGARDQPTKPNFTLLKTKDENILKLSNVQTTTQGSPESTTLLSKPITFGMLESQTQVKQKTIPSSPFASLLNKNKEGKQCFGSSTLEKLSAQYLNTSQGLTPKFGSASAPANNSISCPIFERNDASPADQYNDIRPLGFPLPASKEIQIPGRDYQDSTSAGSSEFGSPSSSSKFTFSPIPNKAQSPAQTCTSGASTNSQESKLSSLSKLKDRYVKNARADKTRTFDDGSPNSPSQEDNRSKRFNFDLSSALVTRKPVEHISTTSNINKILTPKRHTIVVEQLSCMPDARTILDVPSSQHAVAIKRISSMGKVICKKWKGGACENIPLRYKPPHHIPAFKFDTMSPDDEIQSKFKRRR